ncbi:hypothetical protein GCK72_004507 [Caenorhabditis remanei]|uniref:Uncharacterized protein n=1 Tax=Caenorhabditis remanei TaxID=31234 RepID=A0A6A5H9Y2_CAERE|nr:hypothetical protein GCK72_004507 [Caenorhabditis remanei]KAF1764558.1 hypothetical protein GCK72_004507 [Caenorhabditis remanei]
MSGDQELQVLQNTQNVDELITAIEQLLVNESQMMKQECAEKIHNRYIGTYYHAPPTNRETVKKQAKRRNKRKRFSLLNIRQRAQISTVRLGGSIASLSGGCLGIATALGLQNSVAAAIG